MFFLPTLLGSCNKEQESYSVSFSDTVILSFVLRISIHKLRVTSFELGIHELEFIESVLVHQIQELLFSILRVGFKVWVAI